MIRLRKLLLSNKPFIIVLLITALITIVRVNIKYKSNFSNDTIIKGIVKDLYIEDDYLNITLKSKDNVICTYYFKNKNELKKFNINLGDTIILTGKSENIYNNSIPNNFNYKKYLYYKHIYYKFNIISLKKIKQNNNPIYYLKNKIIKHINTYKTSPYLYAFVLGNTKYIKQEVKNSFKGIGISHLFAISGMHISLLSGIILKVLKLIKVEENKRYIITTAILLIYLLLSFSASVLRSFLFFFLLSVNKIYYFYVKLTNIFILTLSISLLINPFFIYDIGFIFSFMISLALIISSKYLKSNSYFIQLIQVSFISFLVSFPITIYNFYEINFFSIIYNLIFVPFISLIVFPLSLITFIIPFFDNLLLIIIKIFEDIVVFLNSINITKLVFTKSNLIVLIIYYIFILLFFRKYNKKYILILIIIMIIHLNMNSIIKNNYLVAIDVGQGDSTLLHINNQNILIDTGGQIGTIGNKNKKSIISDNLILMFKSMGINKINKIVITHGDADHMGEAINLVNNFKVEKVIFNCGHHNYLEKKLIKILNKKQIPFYSCIQELNIDDNKLYFLQTKEYSNENDNSNVIYTEINGNRFLLMGDAGVEKEKDILEKYNISNVDILKVGHHGSKTSSSKEFVNEIKPKYSVISVGKNNRYGHPNKEVLENLKESKIYRTDEDGSIMFKIKNDKLRIETNEP